MSIDDLGIVPTLERYISKIMEEANIIIKFSSCENYSTYQVLSN